MKWFGIILVTAVCIMLAGCAASPSAPPSPPAGGEQPQVPPAMPQVPGNNATPSMPPGSQAPPAPQPVAPQGKPDLQLQSITIDNSVSLYKISSGSITNYNSGTAPSPATKTAYYVDSVLIGTVDVPPMQPGATSTAAITFTCSTAGSHTLSGKIDIEGLVDEHDELNNGRAISFSCTE